MYIYIDVLSACVGRRIERWSCRSPHSTNLKESQHEYHVPSQSVGAVRGTPQSNDVGQAPAWERERQQCHGFPQTFSFSSRFLFGNIRDWLVCNESSNGSRFCVCAAAWHGASMVNARCRELPLRQRGQVGSDVLGDFSFKCFFGDAFHISIEKHGSEVKRSTGLIMILLDTLQLIKAQQEWKLRGKWTQG